MIPDRLSSPPPASNRIVLNKNIPYEYKLQASNSIIELWEEYTVGKVPEGLLFVNSIKYSGQNGGTKIEMVVQNNIPGTSPSMKRSQFWRPKKIYLRWKQQFNWIVTWRQEQWGGANMKSSYGKNWPSGRRRRSWKYKQRISYKVYDLHCQCSGSKTHMS